MQIPTREAAAPSVQGDDSARLIARLAADFVLRSLQLVAKPHQGDLILAIVAGAIVSANTAHLNPIAGDHGRHANMDDIPPDEARRPVSVMAVSGSLGLPFETTRRYVNRLIAAGYCRRVKGGVIFTTSALDSTENDTIIAGNAANVRRLFRELKRAVVQLD